MTEATPSAREGSDTSIGLIPSDDYYLSHGMGNLLLGAVSYKEAESLYARLPPEVIEAVLPFIPFPRDIKWSSNLMWAVKHFDATGVMSSQASKNEVNSGAWITEQQSRIKSGKMPEDKMAVLKRMIPWWSRSRSEIEFESRVGALAGYYREHDAYPPKGFMDASGYDIGLWLWSLRANHKNGKLSSYRVKVLNDSLPGWATTTEDVREERWQVHFNSAVAILKNTGRHPSSSSTDRNEVLIAKWLLSQRRKYQKGMLSKQRITLLDERLPLWRGFLGTKWEDSLEKAVETRDESIGYTYKSCDDDINEWMSRQRNTAKKGKMKKSRRAMLDAKIPDWELGRLDFRESQWEEKLQNTAELWRKHGRIFFKSEDPEVIPLAKWLSMQRDRYNNGILLPERERRLDEVLPQWRSGHARSAQWESYLSDVVDFFAAHGEFPRQDMEHLSPEKNERISNLSKWLNNQRTAKWSGTLSDERREVLDTKLPHWGCGRVEEEFRLKLKDFLEYVEAEGRTPPYSHPLYKWFMNQRSTYKKGKMSQHKIDAFEAEYPFWRNDI